MQLEDKLYPILQKGNGSIKNPALMSWKNFI